jgi:polyketide synthase PksJ
MMPVDVLVLAKKKGVFLYLKEGQLAFKASKGALDQELRGLIAEHKSAIVALLAASSVKSEVIPKRAIGCEVPLTKSQQRMLFLNQLVPESFSYNICIGLMIHGEVDIARFSQIIERVICRHSVLNSSPT